MLTTEQFDKLIQVMQEHPYLFYDVFIDPSFIRKPLESEREEIEESIVSAQNFVQGPDESLVYKFIADQYDDDLVEDWNILVDICDAPGARAGNQELAPFYKLRDAISKLIKLRHDGNTFVPVWSPATDTKLDRALVASDVLQQNLTQFRTLLDIPGSATYELMQPLLDDIFENDSRLISSYTAFMQQINILRTAKRQTDSISYRATDLLPLGIEEQVYRFLVDTYTGLDGRFTPELNSLITNAKAKLSMGQLRATVLEILSSLFNLKAIEFDMHSELSVNDGLRQAILFYAHEVLLVDIAIIIVIDSQKNLQETESWSTRFSQMFEGLANSKSNIVEIVVNRTMNRFVILKENEKVSSPKEFMKDSQKKLIRQENAEFEQNCRTAVDFLVGTCLESIQAHLHPSYMCLIRAAQTACLNRIMFNNIGLKSSAFMLPIEAYKQYSRYTLLANYRFPDLDQNLGIRRVFDYWAAEVKSVSEHALAYGLSKFALGCDSDQLVTPKLLDKFKGDDEAKRKNRMRYIVLEMLLTEKLQPAQINPELNLASQLYDMIMSEASGSPRKKLNVSSSSSTHDLDALVTRISQGDLDDDDLVVLARMDKTQRLGMCGFMLPPPPPPLNDDLPRRGFSPAL